MAYSQTATYTINQGSSVVLHSSSTNAAAYQWYKNNVQISGEVNKDYGANSSGLYTSIAYNSNSCPSDLSDGISIIVVNLIISTLPSASNVTTSGFLLNWPIVQDAKSYSLDVSTSNIFATFVSGYNNLPVGGTSQLVSGLLPGTSYYFRVRAINAEATGPNSATGSQITTIPSPAISTSGTIASLSCVYGSPSPTPASFTVSGNNLTANLSAIAPKGFEISQYPDRGFGSGITLTNSGGTISNVNLYVRLLGSIPVGAYTGNVILSSQGATTNNVPIATSTVIPAPLTITSKDINKNYGDVLTGGSGSTAFTINGNGLKNGNTISSVYINYNSGSSALDPVNSYNGAVVISSATGGNGFLNSNYNIDYIPGNITVVPVPLSITANNISKTAGTILTGGSGFTSFTSTGLKNAESISSVTINYTAGANANATAGIYSGSVMPTLAIGNFNPSNYIITYRAGNITVNTLAVPAITTTGNVAALTSNYGTASVAASFNVAGLNITGGISITPPTGFEISTDNNIFTNTLMVNGSGTIAPTKIYLRLKQGLTAGNYSGNIVLTSIGAADATLSSISGTVNKGSLTYTAKTASRSYGIANPAFTGIVTGFINGDTQVTATTGSLTFSSAATANDNPGTYAIIGSGLNADNYTFLQAVSNISALTIIASKNADLAGLTISAGDLNSAFSTSITTYNTTVVSGINTLTINAIAADVTATITVKINGGTYTKVNSGISSSDLVLNPGSNFITILVTAQDGSTKTYTITVNRTAAPVITPQTIAFAATATKIYGDADFDAGAISDYKTISITYISKNTSVATIVNNKVHIIGAGVVDIIASQAGSDSFTPATDAVQHLTIAPKTLTITANDQTKIYGAINPTLTYTYSGFVNGDNQANLIGQPNITTAANVISGAGVYPIAITGSTSVNYTIVYNNGALTVTPASLIITADNQTKVYGSINPALTYTYNGFVNGDTETNLTTQPTISTLVNLASKVGTYPILINGATSANYAVIYNSGTLTITPAELLITANNQTKVYGAENPSLTVAYNGFVNGDTQQNLATLPTINTIANATSVVGNYPIVVSGAASLNYTFTYVNGNLTIMQGIISQTITFVSAATKTYGDVDFNPGAISTNNSNGITYSSNNTSVATILNNNVHIIGVGTVDITASQAGNNSFSPAADVIQHLTIDPKPLIITANDQAKVYGTDNPELTVTYNGFVNSDTQANLTTQPIISTTANSQSTPGNYPIIVSGATSTNYSIKFIKGTLIITRGNTPQIITFNSIAGKTYGDADFDAGAISDNNTIGITYASSNTSIASIVNNKVHVVGAGEVTITASQAGNDSFSPAVNVVQHLTIAPKKLIITANDQAKIYGAANPELKLSYEGFVNGDSQISLTEQPTAKTTAATISGTGSYPIEVNGAASANYSIVYNKGSLIVKPAALSITVNNLTKVYGEANPVLTLTYSGFVNDDTNSSLITQPTVTTSVNSTTAVGNYPCFVNGATSANYVITYHNGTFVITPAQLIIAANDETRIYGSSNPNLTLSYSGFVNGETQANLIAQPLASTAANILSVAGIYPITVSGAASPNYSITYISGKLTIAPGLTSQIITFPTTATKIYGDADFEAGATSTNSTIDISYVSNNPSVATIINNKVHIIGAGAVDITASQAGNGSFSPVAIVVQHLNVVPKALTITANNQTKVYGTVSPTLTLTYSGFVNDDSNSSLTTQPMVNTLANSTAAAVGDYPIVVSGANAANYTITYINGVLNVTKAPLTIIANNQAKAYGAVNPVLTVSYKGFVNNDNASKLNSIATVTTTATTSSPPGNYVITVDGANAANYSINYVNGTLTVSNLSNADLSKLTISSGILSPTFTSANYIYKTTEENTVDQITFTPTASDALSTILVNGKPVSSDNPTFNIPLNVGDNTITIVVTAQDGIIRKTYTIIVHRNEPTVSLVPNNIMTPNGDGKNDTWIIKNIESYPDNTVTVFDKAGKVIFTKHKYNNDWDGTISGSPLTQGTYYYLIEPGFGLHSIKGFITILLSR